MDFLDLTGGKKTRDLEESQHLFEEATLDQHEATCLDVPVGSVNNQRLGSVRYSYSLVSKLFANWFANGLYIYSKWVITLIYPNTIK